MKLTSPRWIAAVCKFLLHALYLALYGPVPDGRRCKGDVRRGPLCRYQHGPYSGSFGLITPLNQRSTSRPRSSSSSDSLKPHIDLDLDSNTVRNIVIYGIWH